MHVQRQSTVNLLQILCNLKCRVMSFVNLLHGILEFFTTPKNDLRWTRSKRRLRPIIFFSVDVHFLILLGSINHIKWIQLLFVFRLYFCLWCSVLHNDCYFYIKSIFVVKKPKLWATEGGLMFPLAISAPFPCTFLYGLTSRPPDVPLSSWSRRLTTENDTKTT